MYCTVLVLCAQITLHTRKVLYFQVLDILVSFGPLETVDQCEDLTSVVIVSVLEAMANTSESPFTDLPGFFSYLPPLCAPTSSVSASAVTPTTSTSSVAPLEPASPNSSATHHKRPVPREVSVEELVPVATDARRYQHQLLDVDYLINVYRRSGAEIARPSALVPVRDASSNQLVTDTRSIAGV